MSVDAGAAGAFGLYLPHFDRLQDLYRELQDYVKQVHDAESEDEPCDAPRMYTEVPAYQERIIQAFASEYGIQVPPGACLIFTGTEDDRPARCATPAEEWVLGWGMFKMPWEYPEMDASFREHADFHDWVWMG